MLGYHVLDIFFLVFHSALILFNLFGWIWKKSRIYNLITLGLTGASWSILGIFYGPGYCPLTDWHFRVLEHLGKTNLPDSYMRYFIRRLFHADFSASVVNTSTLAAFLIALALSLYVNLRRKK